MKRFVTLFMLIGSHIAQGQFQRLRIPQPNTTGKPELLNYGTFNPYVGQVYHPTDLFVRRNSDGSRFVTVSAEGSLLIFDKGSPLTQAICMLPVPKPGNVIERAIGRKGTPACAAFSPNSQYLLAGTLEGTAVLYDLSVSVDQENPITAAMGLPAQHTLTGHRGGIVAVAFSPDGQLLVTGSTDETIKLWQLSDGKLIHSLPVKSGVTDFCFSPDGSQLIVGTKKGDLLALNATTGKITRRLSGHRGQVLSVSVHPTGEILSGGADSTIRTWDLATGAIRQVVNWYSGPVKQVAYVADKPFFLTVGDERTGTKFYLWEMGDDEPVQTLPQPGIPYVSNVSTANGLHSVIVLARPSNTYTLYVLKP